MNKLQFDDIIICNENRYFIYINITGDHNTCL